METVDKFKVNYHVNNEGLFEPFCSLLDCYDQICYFELRKVSDFNRWIYFCDDINLRIDKCDNLSVMRARVNMKYQKTEEYVIKEDHFRKIDELIKEKGAVALSTAFNYVEDYVWWEKGRDYLHTQHLTYVIAEDHDCYYIADSPWNLRNYDKIRLESNYSIVRIPKEHFRDAFEYYCRVLIIRFETLPSLKKDETVFLKEVLDRVVSNYFLRLKDLFQGRQAILHMQEQCSVGNEKVFEYSFIFHIMVSRRLLLRRSLNRCRLDIQNCSEALEYLDKSIGHWRYIKVLSDDHLYGGKAVCSLAEGIWSSLIRDEDILVNYLQKIH